MSFHHPARTRLLLAVLALAVSVSQARADWTQLGGPIPPAATRIAKSGDVLLFGSNEFDAGDIFRSSDDGETWTYAGAPNPGVLVLQVDGPRTFAGLYLGGILRSTNHGTNWEYVLEGLTVTSFARVGSQLFAGIDGSVVGQILHSTNDGTTWTALANSPTQPVLELASDGNVLLAGTHNAGVFRSTNAGGTWSQATGLPSGASVKALLVDSGVAYAGVHKQSDTTAFGVYRSLDAGASWTKLSVDFTGAFHHEFRRIRTHDGVLYAAVASEFEVEGGLHRSTDGGLHWQELTTNLSGSQATEDIHFEENSILISTHDGLFRTGDLGGAWTYASHGTAAIREVADVIHRDGWLLIGLSNPSSLGQSIWRTTDLGINWFPSTVGLPPRTTATVFLDRETEIMAGIVGEQRGVWRSTDAGASWFPSSTGLPASVLFLCLYDDGNDVVYAGTWDTLYRSTNGGSNWSVATGAPQRVISMIRYDGALLAATYLSGVWRSTNNGASWTPFSAGLTEPITHQLHDFGGTLVISTNGDGVFRLQGSTWVPTGHDSGFVTDLLEIGGVLLAEDVLDGVIYTTDLETWTPFEEGYYGGEAYALEATDTHIIAGSRHRSVWARPISDVPVPASTPVPGSAPSADTTIRDARLLGNPVGQHGRLAYSLSRDALIEVTLVDATGRAVATLQRGLKPAGPHMLDFELRDEQPSGVWFLRLTAEGSEETVRFIHLR